MFGVWSGDQQETRTSQRGRGRRERGWQWEGTGSQGGRNGGQYNSSSSNADASGNGDMRRTGEVGSGDGGRTTIRDLMPHQPNTVIIGIVITKQSIHSFPDKKNPGMDRFKFSFTMRDSPSDYINVTCWGSEDYIKSLVDSFKICDVVELRNAQILSKTGGESEERWRPWTSSVHQLNATEGHTTISLYSGWDYTDYTSLAHIPLRPLNDYYPLNDILSSGQTLEGSHVNLLAIVRHVYSPKQMTSRSGKPLKKCDVRLMDNGCSSFNFTIWDEELIDLAQTWTPKENIIFVVDAKVNFNSYSNSMVASCDQKTIITTNPDCREAHQLYQYAQSLGDLNTSGADEEKEGTANSSFTDISTINRVYTISDMISNQASGKEPSFTGILYAVLITINIDDAARIITSRCSTCKMRVQQGSNQCSNNSCLSSTTTFVTETMFSMPIALADHTGGIEGVRLAGKAANELLTHTPDEFLESTDPEKRMAIKHNLQLERFKIYFKSGVLVTGEGNQRPLVRVLSMSPAQPEEVVAAYSQRHTIH